MIFAYEVKKSAVKEEASNNVLATLDDMVAEIQAQKALATGTIKTVTDNQILSIQSVIEQRALELKQMVAVKRSLDAKQIANRAAEQEAFKLKQRMEIAELHAQNRAALRLRDMALTV
jgi:hypothetical protein